MAETRRLFFALWPDPQVRKGLEAIQSLLPCHRIKATHPEDMHITLAFLGDVDAQRQACVEKVADGIEADAFELLIDQVGYWPRPRILWSGPGWTPDGLKDLVRALRHGLRECGFEPERRPYAAHITLARKARPVRFRNLERPLLWKLHDFALVASRLGGEPPHYQVLRRWDLR
jgi:2'-5' RNA ligase